MQIILEIPEDFGRDTLPELEKQIKLEAGIALFHAGKISSGRACEFAGVDRYRFYEECTKHKIPVINYEPGELEAELEALRDCYVPKKGLLPAIKPYVTVIQQTTPYLSDGVVIEVVRLAGEC